MIHSLTVVDIQKESQTDASYKNIPVANVNDHVVRLSVMSEPFYWHYHPDSDETFLVLEGILCIDLEELTVELNPGQMFTIPANLKHCTRPKGSRSTNITFESATMATIKC